MLSYAALGMALLALAASVVGWRAARSAIAAREVLQRRFDRLARVNAGYRLRRNAARRFVRATGAVPPKRAGHPLIDRVIADSEWMLPPMAPAAEASAARMDPATCSHEWQKRCTRCGAVGRMPKQIPRGWHHSPEDY